ncbi:MAG: glycosyltransferase family 2 protein, partial [Erysipelotrichia bacterium]|nr:glycosyltransferase family 2 protein [Erysipelotrichia bacterium]
EKDAITRVLSHRIDYLMVQLKSGQYDYILEMIERMFDLHIIEDVIDFMNQNKDKTIEEKMMKLITTHSTKDLYLLDQFSIYLSQNLLMKMGIMKKPQSIIQREKPPKEKKRTTWILRYIILAIIVLPLLYVIFHARDWMIGDPFDFNDFIISINIYLVLYFLSVNGIYLLLLAISIRGAYVRDTLYRMKSQSLLFHKNLLPSISIIAPAYNEELSIVESVTALLNLKYPKFEVIVVNDGSKDNTIEILKSHFELERKHPFFVESIETKPIRGVYVNQRIPNLIVIDKQNGGKADALNVGINVAKHDYVCSIDADSLLEEDALLKMMSVTLDETKKHIALGGNIVPVNGSVVDKGKIESHGLGQKPLVKFQTLEYLRAFTTGRIGWSRLRSLLIISGAFGMFDRQTLIEAGGYLTSSSKMKKDTVGEDMELVVRLTRIALEQKKEFIVTYVHQANCYTELPSDFKTLLKQRNRWHRGLLDILSYHRKMIFDYRYKQPGMIGFPYFMIFEMMGPFIEVMGYLALVIGFMIGILNIEIFLLLFSVTIGLGMMISLFSLYIAEKDMKFYSMKETMVLIMIAILENFGYRQMISLHRVISTFSALRDSGSWGTQKRQGFKKV